MIYMNRITVRGSGVFPLDMLRRDPVGYETTWEGKCRPAVEGAIYAKEIGAAIEGGRIRAVPYDPLLKVHTVWDLGFNDSMSIICVQQVASELRIVRYIEDSYRTLADYVAAGDAQARERARPRAECDRVERAEAPLRVRRQDPVEVALPAERAVHQLGGERGVARRERALGERGSGENERRQQRGGQQNRQARAQREHSG